MHLRVVSFESLGLIFGTRRLVCKYPSRGFLRSLKSRHLRTDLKASFACAFSKHYPPGNYVIGALSDSLELMAGWVLRWLSAVRTRPGQRLDLLLEFIVLRRQLAVPQRTGTRRPCFRPSERLFWVFLSRWWANWQRGLIIVQPTTVLCGPALHARAFTRRSHCSGVGWKALSALVGGNNVVGRYLDLAATQLRPAWKGRGLVVARRVGLTRAGHNGLCRNVLAGV